MMIQYYKCNPRRKLYLPLLEDIERRNIPTAFVAIQTTGLMPEGDEPDEIIQISAIKACTKDGIFLETDCLNYCFKPEKEIPEDAAVRNGFTNEMLKGCGTIEQHWKEIRDFFAEPVVIISHNISFLRRFIDALCLDKGLVINAYEYIGLDELARDVVRPGLVRTYTYRNLFKWFDISVKDHDNEGVARGFMTLTNSLMTMFRVKPPKCGSFVPAIDRMEFDPKERNVKVETVYGDLYYNCANGFWEDHEDGIVISFLNVEELQKLAFIRVGAEDGATFSRKLQNLITA